MRLLDDATLDRVYVDLVRPPLFDDLSASAAPELIMVGGQPGAGMKFEQARFAALLERGKPAASARPSEGLARRVRPATAPDGD